MIYMKKVFSFLVSFFVFLMLAPATFAVTFDLIAPSGTLTQGQDIKFTINIDTETKSYTSTKIGMTYDTQYLEYVSVSAGNTFTTVSAEPQAGGKLIISASSTNGYSGSGTFAYVTFKLIATAPGSTQLCALYNPDTPTPTSAPTTPIPTALPTSGTNGNFTQVALGLVFLALAGTGLIVFKNL